MFNDWQNISRQIFDLNHVTKNAYYKVDTIKLIW